MESGRKPGDLTCNEGQCHGRVGASNFTEALEMGPEVEYNTLYLVRPCSSISLTAQNQRALIWGRKESSLAVLKLSLIFQGQDSNSESYLCPNPLELSKK